ncbi:hypothetical protein Tsubulata_006968 [Turnera subulata]|uniref:Inactive rhomboid protein n=1 Tax=Turnera subulata TaxID=218843 RepID=A0A9Q0JMB4_9ROSI|nr:hypothetical protein Tsubulata_006968 [Turnera subulata]
MEEEGNYGLDQAQPAAPSVVSLSPFSPISTSASSRRLSSHFTPSRRHAPQLLPPRLAWVSLQGRLVNAEEASSSKSISPPGCGGGFGQEEAAAWELFTPIQRFLIVAVIGVAVAESKKNSLVLQLKKSVELRDQVLSGMQKKLDNLCEQLYNGNDGACGGIQANKPLQSPPAKDAFGCAKINFVDCGCWHCDQHQPLFAGFMGSSTAKLSKGDEVLQYKMRLMNEEEQEERRMSDLSDWASSVTSTAEIQTNNSAVDQDILILKKDSEAKDATIKELRTVLQSTNMAGSKRIAELEEIIRRKNTVITRLKKDMLTLEEKVVNLTRLRRPSSSLPILDNWNPPVMMDNIVYDMDSTTGPSSSDSDSSPVNRSQTPVVKIQETTIQNCEFDTTEHKSAPPKVPISLAVSADCDPSSRLASPLKEISPNQKSIRPPSRQKQLSAGGDIKKIRRRIQTPAKTEASRKRWA